MATAALDAFRLDTMTPEPEDLETLAPNSAVPSPPQPYSLAPEAQNLQSIIGPGDTLEEELRSKLSQLISRANSKDSDTSEDESKTQILDQQTDKEREMIKEQTERERHRTNDILKDCSASEETSESVEHVNGQEMKRSERLTKNPSMREEGRIRERKSGGSDRTVDEQEQRRGHNRESNRHSKRQHKRDTEKDSEQKRGARSGSSASSPALTPSFQEGVLLDNQVSTQAGNRAAGCTLLSLSNCLWPWFDNSSSYSSSCLYLCANHFLYHVSPWLGATAEASVALFILAAGETLERRRPVMPAGIYHNI